MQPTYAAGRCSGKVPPMLTQLPFMDPRLADAPPKGDGWLHEIKYDGYRTQLLIEDGQARAFTRRGHDWTEKYGPIVDVAKALPCTSAIIDGELIVQDENGISDFMALRSAIFKEPHRLVFFAFDLLHLNGHDLRDMILEDRRELLAELIEDRDPIHLSSDFDGDGRCSSRRPKRADSRGSARRRGAGTSPASPTCGRRSSAGSRASST